MKVVTIALASVLALSGTAALAQTNHRVKAYHSAVRTMPRHPIDEYGNPNGDPGGPTTLSGTGSSQFGGSLPGATGYN